MAKIATRDTQRLSDIPKHARPEEFADDEHLVGLYERELEDAKGAKRKDVRAALARARRSAAITRSLVEEAEEEE